MRCIIYVLQHGVPNESLVDGFGVSHGNQRDPYASLWTKLCICGALEVELMAHQVHQHSPNLGEGLIQALGIALIHQRLVSF